jgi:hypothetical protein
MGHGGVRDNLRLWPCRIHELALGMIKSFIAMNFFFLALFETLLTEDAPGHGIRSHVLSRVSFHLHNVRRG